MSKKSLLILAALVGVVGALISFVLPPFILNLVEHPDGSYLSALLGRHQLKNPSLHTSTYYATYVPAVARRLVFTVTGVALICTLIATRGRRHLRAFWNTPATALNLGVLRLVVLSQLTSGLLAPIHNLSQFGYEGLNIPVGYGWLRFFTPIPSSIIEAGLSAFHVLWALAFFGVLTRVTMPLLTVVSFWLMLGPQLVGKMNHYHHVWLALAALSLGPCGDALSVDSLWRRWRSGRAVPTASSTRYGRTFVWLWSIMGALYFFPGYWKFVVGGFEWAFSDNVQLKLLAKVFETGREPSLRLYEYPWLCRLGGLATMGFEMAFPFAMIFRPTRLLFAFSGIGFHELNRQTMQIGFDSLEWLYLSFVDWSALLRRFTKRRRIVIAPRADAGRLKTWAGAALVAGLVVTGFAGVDSWPWAVYPTFAAIEQRFVNSIEARISPPGGPPKTVLLQDEPALIEAYADRTRLRSFMTFVMMERDDSSRRAKLDELRRAYLRLHPEDRAARFDFWQVEVPLIPRGAPARPTKSLGVLP